MRRMGGMRGMIICVRIIQFNPKDFFDDMDDERAFEALYS